MTLAYGQGYTSHTLAGDLAALVFNFPVYESADLAVEIRDAATDELIQLAVLGVHYTLSLAAAPSVGGTVTPTSALVFASGRKAWLVRSTSPKQATVFPELQKFPGLAVELNDDKLAAMAQDNRRDIDRAPKMMHGVAGGDIPTPVEGSVLSWIDGVWAWVTDLPDAVVSSFMTSALVVTTAHAFAKAVSGSLSLRTYAAARLLSGLSEDVAYSLSGRAARSDGGQGDFYFDAADTTTADNGGTVLVAADGGRLKRHLLGTARHMTWFATSDGSSDHKIEIAALLALGGFSDLDGKPWLTSEPQVMVAGTANNRSIVDNGEIRATTGGSLASAGGVILRPGGSFCAAGMRESGSLYVNGNGVGSPSITVVGIANFVTANAPYQVTDFICRAKFRRLSFWGFILSYNNNAFRNLRIDLDGIDIEDTGHAGMTLQGCDDSTWRGAKVAKCGSDAISTLDCLRANGTGVEASKAATPWVVYGGGAETGMVWARGSLSGDFGGRLTHNPALGTDCCSLMEDGEGGVLEDRESNWDVTVLYAGGYSFAGTSNCHAKVTSIEGGPVAFALDEGGTLENASLTLISKNPTGGYHLDFHSPSIRNCTLVTNGTENVSFSGADGPLTPGMFIGGHPDIPGHASVPPTTKFVSVSQVGAAGTAVISVAATGSSSHSATCRAKTLWKNIRFTVIGEGGNNGVGVFSNYNGHGAYENVRGYTQFRGLSGAKAVIVEDATVPTGITIIDESGDAFTVLVGSITFKSDITVGGAGNRRIIVDAPAATSSALLSIRASGVEKWGAGRGISDGGNNFEIWNFNTSSLAVVINGSSNAVKFSGAVLATGGVGVGNSAAATTPGSVVKKMEVFDAAGASLGYVPIYAAIT